MTTDIKAAYQKALEEYHAKKEPKKKRGRPPKPKPKDD